MRAATGSAHYRPNSILSSNPASNIADKYVQNSVCLAQRCREHGPPFASLAPQFGKTGFLDSVRYSEQCVYCHCRK